MKCYEIDLSKILKVSMLNMSEFVPPKQHITRYINEYILYLVTGGCLILEQDGERLELYPGDVCFFNKGEFQRPLENTYCKFYYIHFETEQVEEKELTDREFCEHIKNRKTQFMKTDIYGTGGYDYIKVLLKRKFRIEDKSRLEHIERIMKNNAISYGYNEPDWRLNVSAAVSGILMKLEEICFEMSDNGYRGKNGKVYDSVMKIADFVETHYKENFDSKDIERELLVNFDYANRIFKKHMGYSIIKYRNRLRINTAKTLVIEKRFDEVANEVGFGDRYYFSRCFKSFEGISPEKYREFINNKTGEHKK